MSAAPPSRTGQRPARPRDASSARFSFITTVDFTSSPDMPMTSASCSSAASIIAEIGCLIPMLTTV
ncbi:PPE family protein [Mycobacteroides abscessus]|nr:PPE family protein [Mycobacteroides abscessus]